MKHFFMLFSASLLLLTGCSDPITGEWENEENNASSKDVLTIESDGTGVREYELELTIDGDKYFMRVEMNLTWESVRDATYDTEVVCDDASLTVNSNASASGCTDVGAAAGLPLTNKFEAECTINDDEDELRCDPEGSTDKVVYKRRE